MKLKWQFTLCTFFLCVPLLFSNCAATKPEMPPKEDMAYIDKDLEALTDLWLKENEFRDRKQILKAIERRHAIDELIFCYEIAGWRIGPPVDRKK